MPQQRGRGARTLTKKQQWRMICSRRGMHSARRHDPMRCSPPAGGGEHARAGLIRAVLESLGAGDVEGGSSEDGGSDITRDSEEGSLGRSTRSVSFDETARVVLVPTRHELLALGRQGGGDGDDAEGGAPREEGLWWTRKDCNQFRRSFCRQIFAQGLQKSCTTLLMEDKMVYKIGRDEENAEEEESGGDAWAGAGVVAGGDGRSGTCSTSRGGTEVSPSSSPILAAVAQDFVGRY